MIGHAVFRDLISETVENKENNAYAFAKKMVDRV